MVDTFMETARMLEPIVFCTALGAAGWFSFRYAWWRKAVSWKHPRVLMYHMIQDHRTGTRFNKLRVPPRRFDEQLAWLKRNGFTFVFASELFTKEDLPERTVCLTFDDGYRDNLNLADPILARYGARATLYLVVDRDGGWSSKKKEHHSDDELAAEPKLTTRSEQCSIVVDGNWEATRELMPT